MHFAVKRLQSINTADTKPLYTPLQPFVGLQVREDVIGEETRMSLEDIQSNAADKMDGAFVRTPPTIVFD